MEKCFKCETFYKKIPTLQRLRVWLLKRMNVFFLDYKYQSLGCRRKQSIYFVNNEMSNK